MQWFLARGLGLKEPSEPGWDLERSEEGTWVHETLAGFFRARGVRPNLGRGPPRASAWPAA